MMSAAPLLLLEVNTAKIWDWPCFLRIAALLKAHSFNGLIIHQQTLLADLVAPSPGCRAGDIRPLIHRRDNALLYLQKIGRYCDEQHLQLWLQGEAVPECSELKAKFPEFFLADTRSDDARFTDWLFGQAIPDLLQALPSVRGLRLSLSSSEMSDNAWTGTLHQLYQSVRRQGRQLVLRDYRDKTWPRHMLKTALDALPADVCASIKATELDYRPGFANNPNLTTLAGYRKWLEFDLWGIEYGWTLLPCYLLEEFHQRLQWIGGLDDAPPEAITLRLNWEWIPDLELTESLNEINLFGLARLVRDPHSTPDLLAKVWLQKQSTQPLPLTVVTQFSNLLAASYEWSCKTPTLLGRVLQSHSQPPWNLQQALHLLHLDTRSANWVQAFQPLMPADDPDLGAQQFQLIELERQQTLFLAGHMQTLAQQLQAHSFLCPMLTQRIIDGTTRALWYTRVFSAVTRSIVLRIWLRKYGAQPGIQQQLTDALQALRHLSRELDAWFATDGQHHPYIFQTLLNPVRLLELARSLEEDLPDGISMALTPGGVNLPRR